MAKRKFKRVAKTPAMMDKISKERSNDGKKTKRK